jgi:hypothetical protein
MYEINKDCNSCYSNGELTFQYCYLSDVYVQFDFNT